MTLRGATRLSTKEAISLRASRRISAAWARGAEVESVRAMTLAPRLLA